MSLDAPTNAAEQRSTIVVAGALAARQWEHYLSDAQVRSAASGWETPPITAYGAWLEGLWLVATDGASVPLTSIQSQALWRRVIAESAHAANLVGETGVAAWAGQAWELLHRWRLDPAGERASAVDIDYTAFLAWSRRYREYLDGNRWLDRAELERRVLTAETDVRGSIILADLNDSYPARAALLEHLRNAGGHLEVVSAPERRGSAQAVRLPDAQAELRAALKWAEHRLDTTPAARIALVVANLAARRGEAERLVTEARASGIPVWSSGSALSADPSIGAALVGLELLGPTAPYTTFGRWLRSPFFSATSEEAAARARLDAELRGELRSRVPFRTAYFECGLASALEHTLPGTARTLTAALKAVGARSRATPGFWAHAWTRALAALGWQSPLRTVALLGWQSSLDELARLTPIVGEISFAAALQELERLLERPEPAALPLRGIHLLSHIDDVGPGYDAVWVTGFTDAHWPEAARANPLLPRALQRSLGMPRASPQLARAAAEGSFARLLARAPALVVSWPARLYDYETEPSPVVRDWPPLKLEGLTERTAHGLGTGVQRETVEDIPPPVRGDVLVGGAGMLGEQARCPLRAFAQYRLGARELERVAFGIPARVRGIATHRAAQLIYADVRDQAALVGTARLGINAAVERALEESFRHTRVPLSALFELEAERLSVVLRQLLEREATREPFEIVSLERELEATLGRWTVRLRVDRLDRLADGRIAILDYKTGERTAIGGWFAPRLSDVQVPLYAIQPATPVGAAVLVKLAATATRYIGIWEGTAFPGRPTRLPLDSWTTQLEEWRRKLEQLASEFALGDTRILPTDREHALRGYAPLSRLHEQEALARGVLTPW